MQTITSPQTPRYTALGKNYGKFEILGCYPGYGTTLGNALRRVLLSSLDGAAAKSVKIKGVAHEFSTISGVMEDVVQIILNLKQVRFKLHGEEAVKITLKSKGEGVVTAAAIKTPSSVEIINPDQVIATITDKKTEFEMEIEIDKGVGYVPVESREKEDRDISVIAIDAIYTPVRRVNYEIENMRVGKRTDYDKITLEVVTDGSITPVEAFEKSVAILVSQFSSLALVEGDASEVKEEAQAEEEVTEVKEKKPKKVSKKKAKSE
ncbi:MAG: DNA-directed RNA polymerase subunit alpha [Candidatus Moranbacteria bacterium RIFCSPLOWO2_02_FULL_48_19]|nr:MAG: DNA-directed RNA polymerase subunit alpha [Candidatus Moranbacteria bacterium RIFCSPLOWO2_02_FULL_48_19]OGI30382.1 MAG: DNA-directed RNA polymerase subunit alpha [Candidatus Moranbacteria bacterium RIFCSPLOWO2_12_FULL_48_12]